MAVSNTTSNFFCARFVVFAGNFWLVFAKTSHLQPTTDNHTYTLSPTYQHCCIPTTIGRHKTILPLGNDSTKQISHPPRTIVNTETCLEWTQNGQSISMHLPAGDEWCNKTRILLKWSLASNALLGWRQNGHFLSVEKLEHKSNIAL